MIKRRCRNPNHAKERRKSTTTKHNFVGMILTGFLQKIWEIVNLIQSVHFKLSMIGDLDTIN